MVAPATIRNSDVLVEERLLAGDRVVCTICARPMRELWASGGYQYYVCPQCGFARVAPVPQPGVLKEYYENGYEVNRENYRRNIRRNGLGDIELLERFSGVGRILEIGSSWGFFLEAARERRWRVQGIELSASAASWAAENLALDVTCGTLEDFAKPEQAMFDVVVAWHVIEHVPDPVTFLRIIRGLLRPGGLLALRTPNIRSAPARLNGWAWEWVGAPAHLSLFSPKSLSLAVARAGFSVCRRTTRRGDALNPVFEILRGSTLRVGIHQRVKRFLKLQKAESKDKRAAAYPNSNNRRSRLLSRMSSFCDWALLPLYPVEKLLDFAGLGPELFLIGERD